MSLHRELSLTISNRAIIRFILLCVLLGMSVPWMGIPAPSFMVVKPGRLFIEDIASLEEEFHTLTALRNDDEMSLEELRQIDEKIALASQRLASALLPPNKAPEKKGVGVPPPRPSVPESIKYPLPEGNMATVPRIFVPHMPNLTRLSVAERKERFIQIILPLILRANDEIRSQRKVIEKAYAEDDLKTLIRYATKYRVGTDEKDAKMLYEALLLRVVPVPVALALAQAAIESGWGQSRFTTDGNALYGQWVWNDKRGIKAQNASDKSASVRAFPDLLASVRAYMFNLNSFYAYDEFRRYRAAYFDDKVSFEIMVGHLRAYAETGGEYVDVIKKVNKQNQFNRFDQVQLKPPIY